jgi:hypothetical protein
VKDDLQKGANLLPDLETRKLGRNKNALCPGDWNIKKPVYTPCAPERSLSRQESRKLVCCLVTAYRLVDISFRFREVFLMKPAAPVVFEQVWAVLSEQCAKIVRLQPVVGMTLVE